MRGEKVKVRKREWESERRKTGKKQYSTQKLAVWIELIHAKLLKQCLAPTKQNGYYYCHLRVI